SVTSSSSAIADMSVELANLSDNNIQEILQRARAYFRTHPPAFERALAMFAVESNRRQECQSQT
ncbi:MAG: hypothetical protein B7X10_06495, partial [Burkholderiales bacterium 21-58-4]